MTRFRFYPAERLEIESIASRLTPEENSLRRWLMEYTLRTGCPFNLSRNTPEHSGNGNIRNLAGRLIEKRAVVLDQEDNVNFIYPVSSLPTNHAVRLADGRSFHAMCAIDALGATFTFEQDTSIQSICSECGQPILVRVKGGRIAELSSPGTHVLHVDLNKVGNWATSC
ncbi:MAG: alkylmercury lyase family protein [Desulfobacteraceae bacterium]|nr:alkylmercury lyase family protein [Desulfobacteraceae bacterium]